MTQYKHVDTELVRLVIETNEGKRVPWPEEVKGTANRNHRDYITWLARKSGKYKLEKSILYFKINFCDTIYPMNNEGRNKNVKSKCLPN